MSAFLGLRVAACAFSLLATHALAAEPHAQSSRAAVELRAIVGDEFAWRETEHFVIAHDCDYSILRPHVGRLEGTYDAVLRFATGCGLKPEKNPSALPILFYDQFQDFAAYARTMGMNPNDVAGFYHTGNNIAAFLNTANAPNMQPINREIERAERSLENLARRHGNAPITRVALLRRNISLWRRQRDRIAEQYNRFVLQHEAAHQVLFRIGVHSQSNENPQWLVEGLACQFEVAQTQPHGKLTGTNHVRLGDLRDALGIPTRRGNPNADPPKPRTDRLMRLSMLVSDRNAFARASIDRTTLYAQSWALVLYLHREFPEAFAAYLKRISQRRPEEIIDSAYELEAFKAAFGEPNQVFLRKSINWVLKLRFDPQAAGR